MKLRFSRTQLHLFSILCYLCGIIAAFATLGFRPMPMHFLAWSLGFAFFFGAWSFAFGYLKQFRYDKDRTLDYLGAHFVVFVLCRPVLPLAFATWAVYAVWNGDFGNLTIAMLGLTECLAYHVAEFLRMKQNGIEVES